MSKKDKNRVGKRLPPIFCLIILLCSCGEKRIEFPRITFDGPFPKPNRDLTKILGTNLLLKYDTDTIPLKIAAFKNYNLITNSTTGDTLFKGSVCKFRGLYYFSQQLNDTMFAIHAVKIKDSLVYGLNSEWEQTILLGSAIDNGKHNQRIVKYYSQDKIRLYPYKKELKNLFSSIIDSIRPDTILNFRKRPSELTDTTKVIRLIDPEEFEFFSKVYPNPTTDFVNVELQQKTKVRYLLTDFKGKMVFQGQFTDRQNQIDLSSQARGFFYLTLINPVDNQKETIQIMKAD